MQAKRDKPTKRKPLKVRLASDNAIYNPVVADEDVTTAYSLLEKMHFNGVIFGVNAVMRSMEKDEISFAVIDSNADKVLTKLVCTFCMSQKISAIIVPGLKEFTYKKSRIRSSIFGIKKNLVESSGECGWKLVYSFIEHKGLMPEHVLTSPGLNFVHPTVQLRCVNPNKIKKRKRL